MANKTLSDKLKSLVGDTGWMFHEDVERHVEESLKEFMNKLEDEDCKLSYPEIMKQVFGDALVSGDEQ